MTSPPARVLAFGTASGLVLMSIFTVACTANTFAAWPPAAAWTVFGLAVAAAVYFLTTAVRVLRLRRDLPVESSPGAPVSGRAFGLVFAAEGVAIWLAALVLNNLGKQEHVVPVIALIVGLHFYPMARIFRRTIDLYLATWTCVVAVAGIVVLAVTDRPAAQVTAAVAVGAALATAGYGFYLARMARGLLRQDSVAV